MAVGNTNLILASSTKVTTATDGARSVAVIGNYSYITNYTNDQLAIFDVTDPRNPTRVSLTTVGDTPVSIQVSGKYAYIALDVPSQMQVVDISNPSAPFILSTTSVGNRPSYIVTQGQYAYITSEAGNTLSIVDISKPQLPSVISTVSNIIDPWNLYVEGKYAYIGSLGGGDALKIVDISNPANPSVIGTAAITGGPFGVHVQGRYAYVTTYTSGKIFIVDVSNPTAPTVVTSLTVGTNSTNIAVSGRYAYVTNAGSSNIAIIDVASSSNPVLLGTVAAGSNCDGIVVKGNYLHANCYGNNSYYIYRIPGVETSALLAHSAEVGSLSVLTNASINNQLSVGGGLVVGSGGILSQGSLAISSTNTTSTFVFAVSTTNAEVSNRLTVGGVNVCLDNGTNCPTASGPVGSFIWSVNTADNTIYNSTSSRDVLIGGSTTATANFILDKNGATSTVIIGDGVGNANLLVGTTTYGGGLNSSFVTSGHDFYVQGMLGSKEGMFSATGVRVGTGTTVYGDGNLYKTAAGDFNLALNDAASNWRFKTAGKERFTIASSSNIGIGISTPLEALDVSGTIQNIYNTSQSFRAVKNQSTGFNSVGVKVRGKYAYLIGYGASNGLKIFDVSDPNYPAALGSVTFAGNAYDFAVDGSFAYVVNDTGNQLIIINISNPIAPYIVKTLTTNNGPRGISVRGRYAYLANFTANSFQIVDISDPANATIIKTIASISTSPRRVTVNGNFAYLVSAGSNNLKVIDISNPLNATVNATIAVGTYPTDVWIEGRYAYITNYSSDNMSIVDISNPNAPVVAKTFALAATDGPSDVQVNGRYAYVTDYDSGTLAIIDVASTTNPILISKPATGSACWGLSVVGRYAYTANYSSTNFSIIDLKGIETAAVIAQSAEAGSLSVLTNASINNQLSVGGGLVVGSGGLLSMGSLAISSTNTTSTFAFAVSSTNLAVSSRLTVGGQNVCLADATNCLYGASPWTESTANNTLTTVTPERNFALVTEKGVATPASSTYSAVVKVTNTTLPTLNQTGLILFKDRNNVYMWGPSNAGTLDLSLAKVVNDTGAGVYTTSSKGLPIWLRIRYSSPTAYFDYSTDGVSYTNATSFTAEFLPVAIGPFHKNWGGTNVTVSFDDFSVNDFSDSFSGSNLGLTWLQYNGTGSVNVSGGTLNLVNGGDWWSGASENAPYAVAYITTVAGMFVDATNNNVYFGYNTNTNLLVGTSTYGGGLNSAFTLAGNDILAQGAIGSLEGMFSATGVRVGTGTTVYGDGNLYKTTSGDFNLSLNDAGSNYRFRSGGQEPFIVASSGNVGIGVANPADALDVSGSIDDTLSSNGAFKQLVNMTPVPQFASGGGSLAVSTKQGSFMYIASGRYIFVFDVSNPLTPRYISMFTRASVYGFNNIKAVGNYLYGVIDDSFGQTDFEIYDITNPTNLRLMGGVYGMGYPYFTTGALEINGNYAYIGFTNGYHIVNIANPANPTFVRTNTLGDRYHGITVNGDYMYAVTYNRVLSVYKVTDPSNPSLVYSTTTGNASNVLDNIRIYGKYAYVGQASAGYIQIYDISNPTYPNWIASYAAPGATIIDYDGRYLYYWSTADQLTYVVDMINPRSPVRVGSGISTSNYSTKQIIGRYLFASGNYTNPYYFHVIDLRGMETNGLLAQSAEIGRLTAGEATIGGRLSVYNSIWGTPKGIVSDGALTVTATGTTSTFFGAITSAYANFTERLTVGGQRVCLNSGTGCISGALAWTDDATGNILYPTTPARDVLLGGTTAATSGFVFDKAGTTSTVIIGAGTGNANLLVGTTTYGGGMNSAFSVSGHDILAQGMIGSLEGMYSATGVRVGTGTTVLGDGYYSGTGASPLTYSEGFESGSFGSGWTTGGNASWAITTDQHASGFSSASSGKISASQSTWLDYEFTTSSPGGYVKFMWKVNSGAGNDRLAVCIDTDSTCAMFVNYTYISGTGGTWAQATVPFSGPGTHSIRWLYVKDASVDTGLDGGWVDDVQIYSYDDYRLTLNDPASNWRFNIGGNETFTVASSGRLSITGITNPESTLDFKGNIHGYLDATTTLHVVTSTYIGSNVDYLLAVQGNYLYSYSNIGSLFIIKDVSNESNPQTISSTALPGGGCTYMDIKVRGDYAYLPFEGCGNGLRIMNISNPASPSLVSSITGLSGNPQTIELQGNYAYLGHYWSNGQLGVVDITNPATPYLVKTIQMVGGYGLRTLRISGRYMYAADVGGTNGLHIFDISDPRNPTVVTSTSRFGNISDIEVQGSYLYAIYSSGQTVRAIDISDPSNPVLKGTINTPEANTYTYSLSVSGRTLMVTDTSAKYSALAIDISNPSAMRVVGTVPYTGRQAYNCSGGGKCTAFVGRYFYFTSVNPAYVSIVDVKGMETVGLSAQSAEIGSFQANGSARIANELNINSSLVVGQTGILSSGALSVSATGTTSTFLGAVSSTYGEFSNRLTVGGQSVCLANRVGCGGHLSEIWVDDPVNNVISQTNAGRDVLFGGSTVATAGFIFDKGTVTSNVIIGSNTGIANLLTGTTTYGGGLNSSFTLSGNDVFVQGMLGSQEGLFSAVAMRVGTGTSAYGDGTFSKTTAGDFTLNLNNAASNWRFNAGGNERLTVASSGNIGIGTATPLSALDINGNIDLTLHASVSFTNLATLTVGTTPEGIALWGKYAAVANYGGNTISILDVSNPSFPRTLSSVALNCPQGIQVSGRYMYVTNVCSGVLNIYDVSNPTSVSLRKSLNVGYLANVKVVGKYAYTLGKTLTTTSQFSVIDVSDPANPFVLSTTTTANPGTYSFFDVQGSYAYLPMYSDARMQILDISNPRNPIAVTSTVTNAGPIDVRVVGNYAYVATAITNNYLQIFDVSNPAAPRSVKVVTVGSAPRGVAVNGRYAYVANFSGNSVSVVDVSSSTAASVITTIAVGTGPHQLVVSGRNMFVANRTAGTLGIYDVRGLESNGIVAASAEFGSMNILTNGNISNDFNIGGGLNVGHGGIYSNGPLGIYATSTFAQDVRGTGSFLVGSTSSNIGEQLQVEGNTLIRQRASAALEAWSTTGTSFINAPSERYEQTAVWTGSKMIVWGGRNAVVKNDGAMYDPISDTWKTMSTTNAPSARWYHSAVWTGSKMIVWGGQDASNAYLNTGAIYDPLTDSWKTMSTTNAPSARGRFSAVWTGSKMIVWGGDNNVVGFNTGAVYDPITDAWTTMTTTNAPDARNSGTAVWTGSSMIVWAGEAGGVATSTGGLYDPASDVWSTVTNTNAPYKRFYHSAVWTGSKMIVWGGADTSVTSTGGIYDPAMDSWSSVSTVSAPSAREFHTSLWTGNKMIVWGGYDSGGSYLNTGNLYDPVNNSWTTMTSTNAPGVRGRFTSVWTGSKMVVWGGVDPLFGYTNTGSIYTPADYQGNLMVEGNGYFNGDLQVTGDTHAGGFYSKSGSDFAEYMPVDTASALGTPSAGDVVVLSSGNQIAKSSAATRGL
ncbi:MAG: hypothetical protein WC551_13050, partial [Patescibacteria group bacterium]